MDVGKKRVKLRRFRHFKLESSSLPNEVRRSCLTDQLSQSEDDSCSNVRRSDDKLVVNRIMVVVDACLDASGALEWVLSRAIQGHDSIILLHLFNPPLNHQGCGYLQHIAKVKEVLHSMKIKCQKRKPGVKVEEALVEGGEKKEWSIVEEAKKQKASVLVLGQRRQSIVWRLIHRWTSPSSVKRHCSCETLVDYCIQNAHCLTVGVRCRSRSLGGYVVRTKAHDHFWLLA